VWVITLWPVVNGVQNFGPDAASHTGAMENLRREHRDSARAKKHQRTIRDPTTEQQRPDCIAPFL
jgi:hypothetical protein